MIVQFLYVRHYSHVGSQFALYVSMATTTKLRNYAGRKLARRLTRSIPYVGAAIALMTIGTAIRRKGLFGGAVHSGLDAIPFVGAAKNVVEAMRGRDFIPDRGPVR